MKEATLIQEIRKLRAAMNRLTDAALGEQAHALNLAATVTVTNTNIIKQIVADYFDMSVVTLCSPQRPAHIAWPRQIAMWFCRELTKASLEVVGQHFGGRDHGTVMFACQRVNDCMSNEPETARMIKTLRRKIRKAIKP